MKAQLLSIGTGAVFLAGLNCSQAQSALPYQYQPGPGPRHYEPTSDTTEPFYVGIDLGGALLQNMSIKNTGSALSFDPGTRGDLKVGWQFNYYAALEFETGMQWNSLTSANNFSQGSNAQHADLYQIPYLVNVVFRLPLQRGFTLYAGGGAGGVSSELDLSRDNYNYYGYGHHTSDTDFTFAYQGVAGIKYAIARNIDLGVGYKFMGTLDHSWFADDPYLHIQTGPAYSHSILASFNFRF